MSEPNSVNAMGGAVGIDRRHDLDALRAGAMLLGIVLHASMTFVPGAWLVQDSRPNALFGLLLAVIHGFRMPLFFLVSGFFTAMLLRRRGVRGLLRQRASRILLPCLVGVATIVPLQHFIGAWALRTAGRSEWVDSGTLVDAIRRGDPAAIRERLDAGASANAPDGLLGVTPLAWAVMLGDVETAALLLERGADVNGRNLDGNTALHGAAFLGQVAGVEFLLTHGADALARGTDGALPLASTRVDATTTQFLMGLMHLDPVNESNLERRRAEVRLKLEPRMAAKRSVAEPAQPEGLRAAYGRFVTSSTFRVETWRGSVQLFQTTVFDHLWFLWFLCWLVPLYAGAVWVFERLGGVIPGRWALWGLLPMTVLPQWLMGISVPTFGADTSSGILPMPHVLLYYGLFFAFGAIDYDLGDVAGRVFRRGWLLVMLAMVLAFPVGLATMAGEHRWLCAMAQAGYAWGMSLGLMAIVRRRLAAENRTIRYLSDSSYFLYLAHLPLVIVAQVAVRDWAWPSSLKLVLICVVVSAVLLVLYDVAVRYTVIGRVLNGPRRRPERLVSASRPALEGVGE